MNDRFSSDTLSTGRNVRIFALLWLILVLIGLGCSDKGTQPKPITGETRFFFTDVNTNGTIFEFDLPSFTLDSFDLPLKINGMTVTPEGKQLIISAGSSFGAPDSTVSYDIETGLFSPFWPESRGFAFSPDGSKVAIRGKPFTILDRSSLSPIFADTSLGLFTVFSTDSKKLYGFSILSSSSQVITIDMENNFQTSWRQVGANLNGLRVSVDDSLWYLMKARSQCTWSFDVFDVVADSIIFTTSIQPGWGTMAVTPDNKYVFFTRTGGIIGIGCPEDPATISVYDVDNNSIVKEISTRTFIPVGPDSVLIDVPVSDIRVSADGRWLVGLGLPQTSFVVVIDISTLSVVHYEFTARTKHLAFLTTRATAQ